MSALALVLLLATTQAAQAPASEQPPVLDYQIGPDDILRVTVYGHDDLTQVVLVQADGTFMFPLIGRVKASDLTPPELSKKIATLLAQGYIRNPQVTVVVQEYRSKTVFVVGQVAKPGTYPLSGRNTTLVEIMARAGPVTALAGAEVLVVRPQPGVAVSGPVLPSMVAGEAGKGEPGKEEAAAPDEAAAAPEMPNAHVFRINMKEIEAGDVEKNIILQPNDTVFVPQAPNIFVSGEVRNPGAYAWFPGMTARQLISVAGGLTPEGSDGRLKIVREVDGKAQEDKIHLDDLVKAGETLVVRRRLF
jgi:polysaccharide export outer membrane protein